MNFSVVLTISLMLISSPALTQGEMLDIYKKQGLILNNVGLIARFPFVHAIAHNLYIINDALLRDLLEFIISSQTDDINMLDLISLETELSQFSTHFLNHPSMSGWLRDWLFSN